MHGPWVEVREDRFFEGAWDGPFGEGAFDKSPYFFGSGAVLDGDGVVFVSASHPTDHVQATRAGNQLLVSNSLPFLLCQARDQLDPAFPRYNHLLLDHLRNGSRPGTRLFPTLSGRGFRFYDVCDTLVRQDLSIRTRGKRPGSEPADFSELYGLLSNAVKRILDNAADPARKPRLRPITTLSRGYDAPAVAVLAARAGCREGFTLRDPEAEAPDADNGAALGERLGLRTTQASKFDYRQLASMPEAEFCAAAPFGGSVSMAPFERLFAGSVLLTGVGGDRFWAPKTTLLLGGARDAWVRLYGMSSKEYRLRVGFLLVPVPYIAGYTRGAALYRITKSKEMDPWRLGDTDYDRPIARRIVEEAGIPRELFGQTKLRTMHAPATRRSTMSASGREDFERFLETHADLASLRPPGRLAVALSRQYNRLSLMSRRLPPFLFRPVFPLVSMPFRELHSWWWASPFLFSFHWGVEKVMERYRTPGRLVDDDT